MEDLLAARERFAPPPRLHVVVKKEDIDVSRLAGRVVIVLDILFATTTIVVYSTTNGTVALRRSQRADAIYAAALLNVQATLDHVEHHHREKPLIIVCAGSAGALNLEDFYAAGCYVERLTRALDVTRDFSDTALSALAAFRSSGSYEALAASRVGRIVRGVGAEKEVRHAAQIDTSRLVAMLRDGRVVRVE